ncbi:pyridoxamine 5'-phosphate oxidase family protein [Clostridiaceae bacterium OttesenSCG-928-D20]|nr:pyridoxamine 5'-phosphate oxidase family protein [Clostridiaceae bacterium OttesenSCG-928-D20]
MQNRMKKYGLGKEQIENLLDKSLTASLATLNSDGSPYIIPVHYVYFNSKIYLHSAAKGQKLDNIQADNRICLMVFDMERIIQNPNNMPCNTNTIYESVIIQGRAEILKDFEQKRLALSEIVEKYTPGLDPGKMPEASIKATAVVEICIDEITGKFYNK